MTNNILNVSVIIPTYNRAKYIRMAIDSVLNQTYKNIEIIVVDDGSADNTREVLSPYMKRIRYFYQDNEGVSGALNTGIVNAKGEWLGFLGSDDIWLPDKLRIQVDNVLKRREVCVHTTNASLFLRKDLKENNMEKTGFLYEKIDPSFIERPLKYQLKYGLARAQCMIVRKKVLLDVGLFDKKITMFEDQDMMCRLALKGPWSVNTTELVHIIRREEQIKNLSQQRIMEPIPSYSGLINVYEKLRQNKNLLLSEKRLVTDVLCSCRAIVGMELLKAKERSKARVFLRQAVIDSASLKSILRYIISFFPADIASPLVSSWQRIKWHDKTLPN